MGKQITYAQLKKISKKRTGKTKKIWGVVCIVLGLLMIDSYMSATDIVMLAVFVLLGGYLLISAVRSTSKWNKYEALVNQYGNTPIPFLAQKMKKPESVVRADIQEMINNCFFIGPGSDITAYINGELNMLVMTRNGVPIEPLDSASVAAKKADVSDDTDDAAKIRKAIDSVTDDNVKICLYNMESSVRRINRKLKESPELEDTTNIRKLKSFYLPQTMVLIDKYTDGYASPQTLESIGRALVTCSEAFANIEHKLNENEDINTQVDIEVLKRTFEREGLLDSDFEI